MRLLNLQGIERRGHRKPRLERYKVCNFKFVDKNIHPIDIRLYNQLIICLLSPPAPQCLSLITIQMSAKTEFR